MSNDKQIDLNHLWVFSKIAESENLTAAAKLLGQDKTRVSRILSDMEKTLGVELVYRTTRQFHLTDAGRLLYQKSRPALLSLRQTTNEFLNLDGELRGHIRLTGAHGILAGLISPIMAEFSNLHPLVTFELIFAQERLDLVKEGIDLAVRMGHPKDSSLRMLKIGDFCSSFVASPSYLRRQNISSFEDLEKHKLLLLESMNNKPIKLFADKDQKIVTLKGAVVCNAPDVLLNMALKGMGIALLPDVLIKNYIKTRELIGLFQPWKREPYPANLIFGHRKKDPVHVRAFADFLADRLRRIINSD